MSLSCSCDFDGDCSWYYTPPKDFSELKTSRRKRCTSCNTLIDIGATVASFGIERPVRSFVEEEIYGDDGMICMANKYLCEKCAGIYFSLDDLGFSCVAPDENMTELVEQYQHDYVGVI